jgi:pimeloyl-ACP methyl ester carboxylesterase
MLSAQSAAREFLPMTIADKMTKSLSLFLKLVIFSACAVSLSACSGTTRTVQKLSVKTESQISQNLLNERLPGPDEVASDAVPSALDACTRLKSSLPEDWFQRYLQVPEDPSLPDGRKIKIFYYGKIYSHSIPTIFFNGGPGGASHSSYRVLTQNQANYDSNRKISFIFIDQRGNGCSDFYPQMSGKISDPTNENVLQRLKFYGSRGIVSDAEYVRTRILKKNKWNVFGQSYGAFIVHRYVMQAPESINAALAHANVLQSDPYIRMRERIAAQVRVMNSYLQQYPEDEKAFKALKSYLTPNTCFQNPDLTMKICGADVLEIFTSHLLGFADQWIKIHLWMQKIAPEAQISESDLEKFVATFYFVDNNPLNSKKWAQKVIGWVDRNVVVTDSYNCLKIKADLKKQGIDLNNSYSDECLGALQNPDTRATDSYYTAVKHLDRDLMTLSDFTEALRSHPSLPFYLYSGQKDAYVPVANFTEELRYIKDLPNVHYTHFLNTGHDGFFTEARVWNDLISQSTVKNN